MQVVRRTARVARWLSYAAAFAAALLAVALYDEGEAVVFALLAAVPAVVLYLFSVALTEAADLPGRLRSTPAELQAALADLAGVRRGRLFWSLWRTGRAAFAARELVTPWAPLLPLVSIPFLAAASLSALATPLLVLAAIVVLGIYG
jgi:hypothetical protein